jgi:23S rRNA pseudouridine1911/1915/1917 synthase
MELKIIYEDRDLLVVDKPAGLIVFPEEKIEEKTLIDYLIENYPDLKNVGDAPRYGIIHRLDKDTSGILLIAKTKEAFDFFQQQFASHSEDSQDNGQNPQKLIKKYVALVIGEIKEKDGTIDTLIGRAQNDRRKQKAYFPYEPGATGKRRAITNYKVLEILNGFSLTEIELKTGRKHQIRTHFSSIHHPIAGDKLYGFKNQPCPEGLNRQFLHAGYLKIFMPNGEEKEFRSDLPEDLKMVLEKLKNN